jgi:hypothetical protein
MAHDVFISHSSEDKPAADAVCAILEESEVRCWIAPRIGGCISLAMEISAARGGPTGVAR